MLFQSDGLVCRITEELFFLNTVINIFLLIFKFLLNNMYAVTYSWTLDMQCSSRDPTIWAPPGLLPTHQIAPPILEKVAAGQ